MVSDVSVTEFLQIAINEEKKIRLWSGLSISAYNNSITTWKRASLAYAVVNGVCLKMFKTLLSM